MDIGDLAAIINLGSNVSYDFELPGFKVVDKTQVCINFNF